MVTLLKISKIQIILVTLGVLLFGFSCTEILGHSSIHISSDSIGVAPVILTDSQGCCNTGISTDIGLWQNIILTVPDKTRDVLSLLALGVALILGYSWISLWNRRLSIGLDVGLLRLYIREHPDLVLFDHLKLAFARGILNPKIYQRSSR